MEERAQKRGLKGSVRFKSTQNSRGGKDKMPAYLPTHPQKIEYIQNLSEGSKVRGADTPETMLMHRERERVLETPS